MIYTQSNGNRPYISWLDTIDDVHARAAIAARLNRVALGLLGNHHDVGHGVCELRIDYGPGYRVYYGEWRNYTVLLLSGGTKRGQQRDIDTAHTYFADFKKQNTVIPSPFTKRPRRPRR